jgi:hypothetical protein
MPRLSEFDSLLRCKPFTLLAFGLLLYRKPLTLTRGNHAW